MNRSDLVEDLYSKLINFYYKQVKPRIFDLTSFKIRGLFLYKN